MDIEERVKRNTAEAIEVLEALKHEDDSERFEEGLKRYIKLRYLLDDDPYWDDDLDRYTAYSIKKTLEKSEGGVKLRDLGINCAGASSAMTKRLLLLISLRKGLEIDLDPEAAALVETLGDLAGLLQSALQSNA